MAQMEWKDAYSVGNELLDSQHKQLIELVNQLTGEVPLSDVLEGLRRSADTPLRVDSRHRGPSSCGLSLAMGCSALPRE